LPYEIAYIHCANKAVYYYSHVYKVATILLYTKTKLIIIYYNIIEWVFLIIYSQEHTIHYNVILQTILYTQIHQWRYSV